MVRFSPDAVTKRVFYTDPTRGSVELMVYEDRCWDWYMVFGVLVFFLVQKGSLWLLWDSVVSLEMASLIDIRFYRRRKRDPVLRLG